MARKFLQFTLDFFGLEPAAPGGTVNAPVSMPNMHPAHMDSAQAAIKIVASMVAAAPATSRHPRATREVLLEGQLVAFELKRRKRHSIGFSVGAEGLAVSAPKWVPLAEIDQAVQGKSGWILKKIHETRDRQRRLDSARIDWKDGATFPFLGEPVTLVLDAYQPQTVRDAVAGDAASTPTLRIKLPSDAAPGQIERAVQSWLKQQALTLFNARLTHFAPQLAVHWTKLSLSSATTRWGSASASGAIRLNWRLLHLQPAVIDYVVVHELSHLRVMDHSPRFWATVASILPDHAALRRQLKSETVPR
ncbi:MAG: SprT family zinc-dependent metalloprotease [Polaromonas sp.]